jgi:hypothetical protein
MNSSEQLRAILSLWDGTTVRDHMSIDEAVQVQYRLVDVAQQVMGSDEVFIEDYGQVRELATVGFGGGGRPRATARVEEVLARFFETEDAVLIHGAGTGSIRAMLNAMVEPGSRILLHDAHPYKTTLPAMKHMGLDVTFVNFNDSDALTAQLRDNPPTTVFVQHVPQQLGDNYSIPGTIDLVRSVSDTPLRILVDDNYAVMRSPRIGVQFGADASSLSLFKLLSPHPIGVVLSVLGRLPDPRTARHGGSAGARVHPRRARGAERHDPRGRHRGQQQPRDRRISLRRPGVCRAARHPQHGAAFRPPHRRELPSVDLAQWLAESVRGRGGAV